MEAGAHVTPPHGIDEVRKFYGNLKIERDPRGGWRIISPVTWEVANMIMLRDLPGMPGRRLFVNKLVVDPLLGALQQWQATCPGYKILTIGCFCPRPKRVNGDLSMHTFGAAFDVNEATNPMQKPLKCDMPDAFIKAWTGQGFTWGGTFSTPDAMHFQYASGY